MVVTLKCKGNLASHFAAESNNATSPCIKRFSINIGPPHQTTKSTLSCWKILLLYINILGLFERFDENFNFLKEKKISVIYLAHSIIMIVKSMAIETLTIIIAKYFLIHLNKYRNGAIHQQVILHFKNCQFVINSRNKCTVYNILNRKRGLTF